MLITEIQTGSTYNNSRKAILVVSEKAKAGQLAELTEFLRSKGLSATLGYNEGHLLRIRNFDSDAKLRTLLTKEFPEWLKDKPNSLGTEKLIEDNAVFIPLDRGEKRPFMFKRLVHQYSTPLVGVLSILSGGAMLINDLLHFKNQKDAVCRAKSGVTAVAAGFFMAASATLTEFGSIAARKPSVTELLKSLEPRLNQDPARFDPTVKRGAIENAKNYAENNPWKIATLFNLFGVIIKSTGHGIPSTQLDFSWKNLNPKEGRKQIDTWDLVGTGSSLVSLGLIGTATPQASQDLLGIKTFQKSDLARDPLARRYANFSSRIFNPLDPSNDEGKSGHFNMKAAGFLSMFSNAVFSVMGANKVAMGFKSTHPEAKGLKKNWPLLTLLPLNLTADYLTTLSKPSFSYSLDELANEAADYIAHKLDMKTATAETVTRQAYILSELLGTDPRVTKSSHQLREAIAAQLELNYGYKMPSQGAGVKEYEHLKEVSPFSAIKPVLETETKPTESFVARVQQPAIEALRSM